MIHLPADLHEVPWLLTLEKYCESYRTQNKKQQCNPDFLLFCLFAKSVYQTFIAETRGGFGFSVKLCILQRIHQFHNLPSCMVHYRFALR